MADAADGNASSSSSWDMADSDHADQDGALLAPEPSLDAGNQQHDHFMDIEKWARMVNGAMTPYEQHCLESANIPENMQADVKKVIKFFGEESGAGAPCKRLMKHLAQEHHLELDQKVSIHSIMFTLAKHLVISERSGPKVAEGQSYIGCSCLASTYTMLEGCTHRATKMYLKDVVLLQTLCHQCSVCLRCGQFLGFGICQGWFYSKEERAFWAPHQLAHKALQSGSHEGLGQGPISAEASCWRTVHLPQQLWPIWQMETPNLL